MLYFNPDGTVSEISDNDALPLEYKRNNRHHVRQAKVSDFVGETALKHFLSPDSFHLQKHEIHIVKGQLGAINHDIADWEVKPAP
ncbi:MAG: hypothetical protein OXF06_13385 [Bacteroidetes bacterium]|nr:hypothetical protein [Bacteroidota bacterium]MCY4225811.1 hypothetical protein [Bacteroidota bacterium]